MAAATGEAGVAPAAAVARLMVLCAVCGLGADSSATAIASTVANRQSLKKRAMVAESSLRGGGEQWALTH